MVVGPLLRLLSSFTAPQKRAGTTPGQPLILYGTAWKKDRTKELVLLALQAGYRAIDTACQPKHYNEAGVGEAVQLSGIPRADIFLQTKYTPLAGQDPQRVPYDPKAPLEEQVKQSVATSLRNDSKNAPKWNQHGCQIGPGGLLEASWSP